MAGTMEDAVTQMMARMQMMESELVQQRAGGQQAQAQTEAALLISLQAMESELLAQRSANSLLQAQVSIEPTTAIESSLPNCISRFTFSNMAFQKSMARSTLPLAFGCSAGTGHRWK